MQLLPPAERWTHTNTHTDCMHAYGKCAVKAAYLPVLVRRRVRYGIKDEAFGETKLHTSCYGQNFIFLFFEFIIYKRALPLRRAIFNVINQLSQAHTHTHLQLHSC